MKKLDLLAGNEYIVKRVYDIYPDFVGTEKWMIVSDLSEDILSEKYGESIKRYHPWVLITVEQYQVMIDWKRNEDRFRRRYYGGEKRRTGKIFSYGIDDRYIEKMLENSHNTNSFWWIPEIEEEDLECLSVLTDVQKRRLLKHIFENMSLHEIAEEEGTAYPPIRKSIVRSIKKLRDYYQQVDESQS